MAAALEVLEQRDPRALRRLRSEVKHLWLRPIVGGGQFDYLPRLRALALDWVWLSDPETSPVDLATTMASGAAVALHFSKYGEPPDAAHAERAVRIAVGVELHFGRRVGRAERVDVLTQVLATHWESSQKGRSGSGP